MTEPAGRRARAARFGRGGSFLAALWLGADVSCGGDAPPGLTVFAAASTTDVVAELARTFELAPVRASFGPSSGLARQIEDGAPADVFVSASRAWGDYLAQAGALAGEPRALCMNRLVCVAPPGARFAGGPPRDAGELARSLPVDARVAIADAGVPAGEAARQSLAATGDAEALHGRLVGQTDVRAVLRAAAAGHVDAGFVYATDARAAEVDVLFELDPATYDTVEYVAAVTRRAARPDLARAFLDHLTSPASRRVLARAGFAVDEP